MERTRRHRGRWSPDRASLILATLLIAVGISGCFPTVLITRHDLRVQPSSGIVGQPISFEADWDLGTANISPGGSYQLFELDPSSAAGDIRSPDVLRGEATATYTYESPRTITVSHLLNVVSADGLFTDQNLVQRQLIIRSPSDNQPPLASFSYSPSPAHTGQDVQFNASASSDPDGSIVKYEWDLDGNGSFETDTGTSPFASQAYGSAGLVPVGLRVTDNGGLTGQTAVLVAITPATLTVAAGARSAAASPAGKRFSITLGGKASEVTPGIVSINGTSIVTSDRIIRGQGAATGYPSQLRKRKRPLRFATKLTQTTEDSGEGPLRMTGISLIAFPRGGRACLAFQLGIPAARTSGTGAFKVLGASGRARRLRGSGSGTLSISAEGASRLRGEGRLDMTGKPSRKVGRYGCGELARFLPAR